MDGVHHSLTIKVVKDSHEATRQGFFYRPPIYKPLRIEQVVVVELGTESGKPTVDIIFENEEGQKYVVLLTGKLLKSIPC